VTETFRVEITSAAERDIEDIWEYIAYDNPEDASFFISNLEEQIVTLESFPFSCPLVPENELLGTGYRHLLYGRYRIIFRVISSRVIIMRIVHQYRLLDPGLFQK